MDPPGLVVVRPASEVKLEAKLHLTCDVGRTRHSTISLVNSGCIWRSVNHLVEGVKHLKPELELLVLRDGELAEQGKIEVLVRVGAQGIPAQVTVRA